MKAGKIITTHGLRGEVKVYPLTDSPDDFKRLKEVVVKKGDKTSRHRLERAARFKNVMVVKLSDIDDVDTARTYVDSLVLAERDQLKELRKDQYYEADLIGMKVSDERYGELGVLSEVLHTGANDVYSVRLEDGKELLLPAIHSCILDVDVDNKSMRVHVLDGLMEL
ncbi:MAG: 16S rRNA processing protein RimM [Lachnospiraceae bacterium]|nr:16S rRNA processing protein RimM [Lachnospiraceae bacterium]